MTNTNDNPDDAPDGETALLMPRRQFTKAAAATAVPLSHSTGDDSFWSFLGGSPDLVIEHDGEVISEDPQILNFQGSAIKEIVEPNEYDDVVRITLEDTGGDGGGGGDSWDAFEDDDDDNVAELVADHTDHQGGDARNVGAMDAQSLSTEESRTDSRTVTLNVPTDFNTVSAAIDDIRELRSPPGVDFDVHIESGHTFQETVHLEQADLRHVKVTAADATVPIDSSSLTNPFDGDYPRAFIGWFNTSMPELHCLFNGEGNCWGLTLGRNSHGYIAPGCGFESVYRGAHVTSGASLVGDTGNGNVILRNNDERGCQVGSAFVFLRNADLSGNSDIGLRVTTGGWAVAQFSDLSNCRIGLRPAQNSVVEARETDLSNATDYGLNATSGADVTIISADASGAGTQDINVTGQAIVRAGDCTTTNGSPSIQDINIGRFNAATPDGLVWGPGSQLVVDAGNFSHIQDALDYAETEGIGLVRVPDGEYGDSISVPRGVTLEGQGRDNGPGTQIDGHESSPAIEIGSNATVRNIRVNTGNPIHLTGAHAKIDDCFLQTDVEVQADRCQVLNTIFNGESMTFTSNTSGGVADALVNVSVTDNGSNTVGTIG